MRRRPQNLVEAQELLAYIKAHQEELSQAYRERVTRAQASFRRAHEQHTAIAVDPDSAESMDNYCASAQDLHAAAFELYSALADDPLTLMREAKEYLERFSL